MSPLAAFNSHCLELKTSSSHGKSIHCPDLLPFPADKLNSYFQALILPPDLSVAVSQNSSADREGTKAVLNYFCSVVFLRRNRESAVWKWRGCMALKSRAVTSESNNTPEEVTWRGQELENEDRLHQTKADRAAAKQVCVCVYVCVTVTRTLSQSQQAQSNTSSSSFSPSASSTDSITPPPPSLLRSDRLLRCFLLLSDSSARSRLHSETLLSFHFHETVNTSNTRRSLCL